MVGIKDSEMSNCCTNSSFEHCQFYDICRHRETIRANCKPNNCPLVEVIPKDQYKADLVAMLRFLWNEIEDLDAPICDYASSDCISKWQVHEIIQQKIDKLKENTDGNK